MKGKLIQLCSSHSNLRTKEIVGIFHSYPELSQSFMFLSVPLEFGDRRVINTSKVNTVSKYMDEECQWTKFTTNNSTYLLEY